MDMHKLKLFDFCIRQRILELSAIKLQRHSSLILSFSYHGNIRCDKTNKAEEAVINNCYHNFMVHVYKEASLKEI